LTNFDTTREFQHDIRGLVFGINESTLLTRLINGPIMGQPIVVDWCCMCKRSG